MKTGLFATFMSPIATPDMVAAFARDVESAGVDEFWLGEHVVLFDEMEFPYPGSADGRIPVPEGGGLLDTVATIGFIASQTRTLRLGTGITLVPQRNPVYTAKEFATLDWLSGGRIDFGVGVGWCKEESLACGYAWENRGARCDEFLELMRRLWTEEVTTYQGEFVDVKGCRCDPKPVQTPFPIIVGGLSDAALRRTARFGTGWYGFNLTLEATATVIPRIDAALADAGRTRDGFEIVVTPPFSTDESDKARYEDLGVDQLVLHLGSQRPEKTKRRLEQVERFIAA